MDDEIFQNPILTLDVDWAPDFIIDDIAEKISKRKIKATWFVTHFSKSIENLKSNPLFELGIHPNFNSNSTQGKDPDDILKNLKKIIPKAKSIRTHGLIQSTEILLKFKKYNIKNDVSILLSNEHDLKPHYSKYLGIFRFPFFWEDDVEIMENSNWEGVKKKINIKGLKIFNFHPIHIFLNSDDMKNYNKLKKKYSLQDLDRDIVTKYINQNLGAGTFFDEFLENLMGKKTHTISNLSNYFRTYIKE